MILSAIELNSSLVGILLDVIVIVILAATLLLGIKKGFLRMIRGLITLALLVVISIFAVVPATNLLSKNVNWDEQLADSLVTPMNNVFKYENPYTTLAFLGEDDAFTNTEGERVEGLVFINEIGEYENFSAFVAEETGFIKKIGFDIIEKQALNYLSENPEKSIYLINSLTNAVAVYIMLAIVETVILIISSIIISILFSLLKKATRHLYVAYILDKIAGGIFGFLLGAIFVYLLITVMLLLKTNAFMEPVNLGIQSSYLVKYIASFDFLYVFLRDFSIFGAINDMIKNLFSAG